MTFDHLLSCLFNLLSAPCLSKVILLSFDPIFTIFVWFRLVRFPTPAIAVSDLRPIPPFFSENFVALCWGLYCDGIILFTDNFVRLAGLWTSPDGDVNNQRWYQQQDTVSIYKFLSFCKKKRDLTEKQNRERAWARFPLTPIQRDHDTATVLACAWQNWLLHSDYEANNCLTN